MKKIFVIAFCLCLFTSSRVQYATIYYVDTTGNDANAGTVGSPFLTLFHAVSIANTSGDIIHVNAGTYTETATCFLNPGVSIEGDGITTVIKSTLTGGAAPIIDCESAEGTNGNQNISFIKLDGQNTTDRAIEMRGRKNFSMHDCTVINFVRDGIWWGGRADNTDGPPTTYATGNSFYNNTVTNCASYVGDGRGELVWGGQDGFLIYGNTFNQTGRTPGTNGYCLKPANFGWSKNCKIYNNSFTREDFDGTPYDFACEIFNNWMLEIYNNTFIGSVDLNYQSRYGTAYSVWIHNNTFGYTTIQTQLQRGVVEEYDCENSIIEFNNFNNLKTGIAFSSRASTSLKSNRINNNLFKNVGTLGGDGVSRGIHLYDNGSASWTSDSLWIVNNTFIGDSVIGGTKGIDITNAGSMKHTRIQNNNFIHFNDSYIFTDPGATIDSLWLNHNNIYNCGFSNGMHNVGGSPTHMFTGSDLNYNQPLTSPSFLLTAGSSLIGAGTNVGYGNDIGDKDFLTIGRTNDIFIIRGLKPFN